ncbi:hypothetical protein GCM10025856_27320 [Methylophaga marina]|uniref:THIF-type NAD/FAD binding fold domain-containing protein n=1 Tax=Methylophaga marina TaxID=45495 RepID=A0ABN0TUB9_9GAMM|nr:hypothetical protein [Methylophaga marina]BDZ75013.1 hypothetical protein GCM10025856_27320 [Methylophaga marina]
MKFLVPHSFIQNRLKIAVVGVGGTGGEVMDALTRLDFGLKALGHPKGIHVTAFDADIVEPHNIGRHPERLIVTVEDRQTEFFKQ